MEEREKELYHGLLFLLLLGALFGFLCSCAGLPEMVETHPGSVNVYYAEGWQVESK